jgi:hypothetical protein
MAAKNTGSCWKDTSSSEGGEREGERDREWERMRRSRSGQQN